MSVTAKGPQNLILKTDKSRKEKKSNYVTPLQKVRIPKFLYKALSCVGTDRSIHGIPVKSDGQMKAIGYCHFQLNTSSPDFHIVNRNKFPDPELKAISTFNEMRIL